MFSTVKVFKEDSATPLSDATVRITSAEHSQETVTNSEGIAYFFDAMPESFIVTVSKKGYKFANQQVTPIGDTEIEVFPQATHVLEGTRELAESIWRDSRLPIETFEFDSVDDAIDWVQDTVLPEASSYVDAKINQVIVPYSFPLENDVLLRMFPGHNWTTVSFTVKGWDSARASCIRFMSLYRIFLLADSVDKEYIAKAEAFRRAADESLSTLTLTLGNSVSNMQSGGRKFGLLIYKTRHRRGRYDDGEFSY